MSGGSAIPLVPGLLITAFIFALPLIYLFAVGKSSESPKTHGESIREHRENDDRTNDNHENAEETDDNETDNE